MSDNSQKEYTEISKLDQEARDNFLLAIREKGIILEAGMELTAEQAKIVNEIMEELSIVADGSVAITAEHLSVPEAPEVPTPEEPVEEAPEVAEQPLSYDEAFRAELSEQEISDLKELPEFYLRAMYLKEIQKEGNEELYDLLAKKHIVSATKDDSGDFENDRFLQAVHKYNHIDDDPEFEEIRNKVNARIEQITDRAIKDNLRKAGYSNEDIKLFTQEHMDSLRLQKAFFSEVVYEDGNKKQIGQAFNDALSKNKDAVLGFLANKNTQYALNGLGLALAISSGGTVPLLMQGIKFAGMAMKNETVQGIFKSFAERVEKKCADYGIDITPAKEAARKINDYVEEKKSKLSTKSKVALAIASSVAAIGLGVTLESNGVLPGLSEAASSLGEKIDAAYAGAEVAVNQPEITISEFKVANEDTATSIAREAYKNAMGVAPTEQQLVAIINDMGFADPNHINPGDTYKLPSSFEDYAVDKIGKVNGDWLGQAPAPVAVEPISSLDALASAPVAIDLQSQFNIEMLANKFAPGISLSDIQQANPDVDIFNLNSGDELMIGGTEYNVPEIDDVIISSSFGEAGAPEFIDADAYIDLVKEANPHIDFSEGFLGFGGNGNIGADLAQNGALNIPSVDVSSLEPVSGEVVVSGVVYNNNLNVLILNSAFPDGVPDLIDGSKYCEVVREMNSGLNHASHGDYFSKELVLPTLEQVNDHFAPKPEAPAAINDLVEPQAATQRSANINENEMFERARAASKTADKGLSL